MTKPIKRGLAERALQPAKQIAHEELPFMGAQATKTGGDPANRTINNYAKMTPADANGLGSAGQNIFSMGRDTPGTGV